ncbi:MAG TPA: lactate racemase domain-containing protein [Polyangia bacterium]|nr:lactate racemase domain-containing protein [Polyangia bacterium]
MAPVPAGQFPHMTSLRQEFASAPALDIAAAVERGWTLPVRAGSTVAIAVGSRGIARIDEVVRAVICRLRAAGAQPFIVPAMGSHAGATAAAQAELLAGCGISEAALGVPVRASMEVKVIGQTEDGVPVHMAAEALAADGIVVINRIKPHTDLHGPIESGLLKMIAVGLGKQIGAGAFHAGVARFGFSRVVLQVARISLAKAPVLGGVALVENQRHQLARLEVLPADRIVEGEQSLLEHAKELMPRIPFDDIDLLIVDSMGKNISGAGMDPNVIGRSSSGYVSTLTQAGPRRPFVRRLFVRELTPESHGNATGLGLADFATTRLVKAIDSGATYTNALTSLSVLSAKIPIHFDSDREVLANALATLAIDDARTARVVRIRDTLSLGQIEVSETLAREGDGRPGITLEGAPAPMRFDAGGNLLPLPPPR